LLIAGNYFCEWIVILVMSKADTNPAWINTSVLVGAGLFIFALSLSAVFDPRIRLLHVLQALIYIAVIVLTRKTSAWGFGAGCVIALFWNYINLFVTSLRRSLGLDCNNSQVCFRQVSSIDPTC
jgi:hypothetical protein